MKIQQTVFANVNEFTVIEGHFYSNKLWYL
jgi:hypothetical protein